MKKIALATGLLVSSLALVQVTGCAQWPVEKMETLDNRPQISFTTQLDPASLTVSVDGIPNGTVKQYLQGKAALRVLPGMHVIQIGLPSGSTNSYKIYVSDGVTKTLQVP